MRTVLSEGAFAPFDPVIIDAMGKAFDVASHSVAASGVKLDDKVREQLALRIIAKAQAGERDVMLLSEDAVAHVSRANRSQKGSGETGTISPG
jgi:hypothetical protein